MPLTERKLWSNNGSRTMALGYHANWQGYIGTSSGDTAPYIFSHNLLRNKTANPGSTSGSWVYGDIGCFVPYKYGHNFTLNSDHTNISTSTSSHRLEFGDYFSSSNIGKASSGTLRIRCGYYSTGGYGYQYTIQGYSDGTSSPGSSGGSITGDSLEFSGQDSIRINALRNSDASYAGSTAGQGTYLETLKEVSWESSQPSTTNTYGTVRLRTTNTGPFSTQYNSSSNSIRTLYIEGQMHLTSRGSYATTSRQATLASFTSSGSHTASGYVLFVWSGSNGAYGDWTDNPLLGSTGGTRKASIHTLY